VAWDSCVPSSQRWLAHVWHGSLSLGQQSGRAKLEAAKWQEQMQGPGLGTELGAGTGRRPSRGAVGLRRAMSGSFSREECTVSRREHLGQEPSDVVALGLKPRALCFPTPAPPLDSAPAPGTPNGPAAPGPVSSGGAALEQRVTKSTKSTNPLRMTRVEVRQAEPLLPRAPRVQLLLVPPALPAGPAERVPSPQARRLAPCAWHAAPHMPSSFRLFCIWGHCWQLHPSVHEEHTPELTASEASPREWQETQGSGKGLTCKGAESQAHQPQGPRAAAPSAVTGCGESGGPGDCRVRVGLHELHHIIHQGLAEHGGRELGTRTPGLSSGTAAEAVWRQPPWPLHLPPARTLPLAPGAPAGAEGAARGCEGAAGLRGFPAAAARVGSDCKHLCAVCSSTAAAACCGRTPARNTLHEEAPPAAPCCPDATAAAAAAAAAATRKQGAEH